MKVAFFLTYFLFHVRAIHRLKFINLWAEDATIYATDAFAHGWKSIFMPIVGYQTFIQRVIAWIGLAIPLDRLSLFFYECYVICAAAVLAYFVHDDFEHIIPGRKNRILVATSLTLVAGLGECLGNLCNLHWYFSFALGLLVMRKLEAKMTWRHISAAILLGFSAAESMIFIPFFLSRYYLQKKNKLKPNRNELVIAASFVGIALINYFLREAHRFNHQSISVPLFYLGAIYTLMNHYLFEPTLGAHLTQWVGARDTAFWIAECIFVTLYARLFFQTRTANERLVYLALLPFLGTTFLSWFVREDVFNFYFVRERDYWYWHMIRYSLNTAPIGAVLALSQLPRLTGKFNQKIFLTLAIAFIAKNCYYFEIFQYGNHVWTEQVRKAASGPVDCNKIITIESDPQNPTEKFNAKIPGRIICEFKAARGIL